MNYNTKTKTDFSDPMVLLEIEGLARDGYDDDQIIEILDFNVEGFKKALKRKQANGTDSELSNSLRKGRRPYSVLVENALYKRTMGHTVKSTIKRWLVGVDGKQTDVEIIQETETEIPGDVAAQLQWLKVHKPEMYNVQPERIDVTSKGNELKEPPQITAIHHIVISDKDVIKNDEEQLP